MPDGYKQGADAQRQRLESDMNASLDRRLLPFLNRLSLKIAGSVAVIVIVAAAFAPAWPVWTAPLIGLGLGLLTYVCAHYWLDGRLDETHALLQKIRQHDFDGLSAPAGPRTDELGDLLWELYRTGQHLETEIQDFRERENYRREFIGNVSHELKTPIFSVQGFTETLLEGALEDEEVNRTFLEKILHNVTRLENLARDLSAITEIETGEMEMSRKMFDIREMYEEVRDSLELKAREKDIALRIDAGDELPSVYGDPDRIRRVIVNLADNAIKYNVSGGTVTLHAQARPDGDVRLSVVDDGIGISEEHLPRLTERFYRVDKSRSRNQGGTGLGLAIVKHILGAHDRTLNVESRQGEGSTFSFTLPTTRQPSLQGA